MVKKQKTKDKLVLKKNFYDLNAVKEALNDFKKVCEGKIINKKDNIEIFLKAKNKNFENNLSNEFCNYVLGLMKNRALV
ncbi:HxsD-like protein [Candidatus Woesearchaeota archaeon]|nr:HxsD-like protein [Candidatus Woesearchaeota archaeon]